MFHLDWLPFLFLDGMNISFDTFFSQHWTFSFHAFQQTSFYARLLPFWFVTHFNKISGRINNSDPRKVNEGSIFSILYLPFFLLTYNLFSLAFPSLSSTLKNRFCRQTWRSRLSSSPSVRFEGTFLHAFQIQCIRTAATEREWEKWRQLIKRIKKREYNQEKGMG